MLDAAHKNLEAAIKAEQKAFTVSPPRTRELNLPASLSRVADRCTPVLHSHRSQAEEKAIAHQEKLAKVENKASHKVRSHSLPSSPSLGR